MRPTLTTPSPTTCLVECCNERRASWACPPCATRAPPFWTCGCASARPFWTPNALCSLSHSQTLLLRLLALSAISLTLLRARCCHGWWSWAHDAIVVLTATLCLHPNQARHRHPQLMPPLTHPFPSQCGHRSAPLPAMPRACPPTYVARLPWATTTATMSPTSFALSHSTPRACMLRASAVGGLALPARPSPSRLLTWLGGRGSSPAMIRPPMGVGGHVGAHATLLCHRLPFSG
jgi:hypothetical protein